VDLRGVAAAALDVARPLLGRRVRVRLEHSPGDLAAWADPDDLEQVALVLLLGAAEALPAGGLITLATGPRAREGGAARGEVALVVAYERRVPDGGTTWAADPVLARVDGLLRRHGGRLLAQRDSEAAHRLEARLPRAA
jgi:hypothetical protein